MDYYPMSLDIRGWNCLVVGGGPIGYRRAERFHRAGARVVAVSRSFVDEFDSLDGIVQHRRAFDTSDLNDMRIVQAATSTPELNREIGDLARDRGILVNLADDPSRSDFRVPVLVERGDLQLAITTNGSSPAYASRLRQELSDWLPTDIEAYLSFLGRARRATRDRIADESERARIGKLLASPESYARFAELDDAHRNEWVETLLHEAGG